MIKKLLYITPEYPPKVGGIATISNTFANAYKAQGLIVEIITPGKERSNQSVIHINPENSFLKLIRPLTDRLRITNYLIWLNLNIKLFFLALINHIKNKYDLIETHDYYALGIFVFSNKWLFNLIHKVKFIVRISGPITIIKSKYYFEDKLENKLIFNNELPLIGKADIVTYPSQSMFELIEKRIGNLKKKIKVLPPMIKEASNVRLKKSNYLIYIGRIQDGKGVEYLIKSWLNLPSSIKQKYYLKLIGDDTVIKGSLSFKDYLIKKYKLDNDPSIMFNSALSNSDLLNEIASSVGVIIPSVIDNYPTVAMEAILFNKPIIGTTDTGVEDIIKDLNYPNFIPIKPEEIFTDEISKLINFEIQDYTEDYNEILKSSFTKYFNQLSR